MFVDYKISTLSDDFGLANYLRDIPAMVCFKNMGKTVSWLLIVVVQKVIPLDL
jgi:hypothetical protein